MEVVQGGMDAPSAPRARRKMRVRSDMASLEMAPGSAGSACTAGFSAIGVGLRFRWGFERRGYGSYQGSGERPVAGAVGSNWSESMGN